MHRSPYTFLSFGLTPEWNLRTFPRSSCHHLFLILNTFLYNGHIIKKEKCINTSPCNCYTVRVVVVYAIYIFENHPFASYGAGWFSCLERFPEKNMRYFTHNPVQNFTNQFKKCFHDDPLLPLTERRLTTNHPHNIQLQLHSSTFQ